MIFLGIQSTYDHLEIALFGEDLNMHIAREEKQYASKNFVILLDSLLKKHGIKLTDIVCCIVNQGPSPFTTLRTVIASVNSLYFALNIPLIGIDGIEALLGEYKTIKKENTLILLNAFNNDVYFCLERPNRSLYKGCLKVDALLDDVREQLPSDHITFLGNGVTLYEEKIDNLFSAQYIHKPDPMPATCSIEYISSVGFRHWQNKERMTTALSPLYLKQHAVYDATFKLRNIRTN